MIESLGPEFLGPDMDTVINLLMKSSNHINRFVREITYFVAEALFWISDHDEKKSDFESMCEKLVPLIVQGLADNWSQVRFAASWATRAYYEAITNNEELMTKYNP